MKKILMLVLIFVLCAACSHVPRTAIMVNPETGQEVTLTKKDNPLNWFPIVGIATAGSARLNQQHEMQTLKDQGYQIKYQSTDGL